MGPKHLRYERLMVGELQTNAYLLFSTKSLACLIIDPGAEPNRIIAAVEKLKLLPSGIILTHGHYDHIGGVKALMDRYAIPLWIHEEEQRLLASPLGREMSRMLGCRPPPPADHLVREGDRISFEDIVLTVLHTPGHTPGSISLSVNGWLFTGDTLFQGSIGRTDLPGGDFSLIKRSLDRLLTLPEDTVVLPGHGDTSTISEERSLNPYL